MTSRNRPAAFTLIALTPLIAELALGSTPIRMAWLVILWVPIYGAGVLFIRELVVRRGRGWPSILLLAVAYELIEDGIGLQALTSPHLYDAADWGLRVFGFNLPYWEANTIYHAVFTLLIPIALTDLLFPAHRGVPYLGRPGLTVAGVVAALGVGVLRVSVPPSEDPGYQVPLPLLIGYVAAVVLLGIIALAIMPPARSRTAGNTAPSRTWLFAGAGLGTLLLFALTFPMFGARQPAFTHGATVLVPMVAAAALAALAVITIGRLSRSTAWTERHTLALIAGALIAHSIGGLVIMAHTTVDRLGLIAIIILTGLAMLVLDRRLRDKVTATTR
ncbi:hypothetical protein ACFT2C_02770 [Promicromonospora sp. NPDC057138]|uniref:hypothetical protein n=1 Tax=Promicromonospora sp. NPDC057138 TaxID=3346031 RepID=UPI00363837D5